MILEKDFKNSLLQELNPSLGWIDGDTEILTTKKVDIVNHILKIAIEVKDDTFHKTIMATPENPFVAATTNLTKMNELLSDHIKKARLKFKNYRDYKTILLIRTEHRIMSSIRYSIDGLHSFSPTQYIGRKGKYSLHIRENTGCYIICDSDSNFHYIPNPHCKFVQNIVTQSDAERIFKRNIDEIEAV